MKSSRYYRESLENIMIGLTAVSFLSLMAIEYVPRKLDVVKNSSLAREVMNFIGGRYVPKLNFNVPMQIYINPTVIEPRQNLEGKFED